MTLEVARVVALIPKARLGEPTATAADSETPCVCARPSYQPMLCRSAAPTTWTQTWSLELALAFSEKSCHDLHSNWFHIWPSLLLACRPLGPPGHPPTAHLAFVIVLWLQNQCICANGVATVSLTVVLEGLWSWGDIRCFPNILDMLKVVVINGKSSEPFDGQWMSVWMWRRVIQMQKHTVQWLYFCRHDFFWQGVSK